MTEPYETVYEYLGRRHDELTAEVVRLRSYLWDLPNLRAVADWMDTHDKLGSEWAAAVALSNPELADRAKRVLDTLAGTGVQDDLRAYAARVDAELAGQPGGGES